MSRILLVDDAVDSREAMSRLLKTQGHEVVSARNGAEGMVRLRQQKPDLIVLDQMMPEVDGLTFLASVRRFPKFRDLPVIMLTGSSDRTSHQKAHTLGVREYMIKSQVSPSDLLGRIEKHAKPC